MSWRLGRIARALAAVGGPRPARSPRPLRVEGRSLALHGDPADPYFRAVRADGPALGALAAISRTAVPAEATVLDVGANIGVAALLLAVPAGRTVYAFEPHPGTFGYLAANIAANDAANIIAVQAAVGAAAGDLPLHEDASTSSANHLVVDATLGRTGGARVPVVTVDGFVAERGAAPVAFLKVDVEGFEPAVLAGAAHTIARDRPSLWIEFNLFTLMAVADRNPRDLLSGLLDTFPFVYRFAGGRPYPIRGGAEAVDFLHDLCVSRGAARDLYCSFAPLSSEALAAFGGS